MKVLPLYLLCVTKYIFCHYSLPGTGHQPYFVCSTFPYCTQDTVTGVWRSLPMPASNNTKSLSKKGEKSQSSDCFLSGYYYLYDDSNLIKDVLSATPTDCQRICGGDYECQYFSYHHTRGHGHCLLLRGFTVDSLTVAPLRECRRAENCAAGQKTCDCPSLDYFPGSKYSTEYARWSCGDIDPYSSTIPVGTTCSVSCPSWEESPLQSTCLLNGKWSPTEVSPEAATNPGHAVNYPTPDQEDRRCQVCKDVGLFKYDPNTEEGARFVCQGSSPDRFADKAGWSIKHGDQCDLFCGEGSQPSVSVYCDGATWRGEPELGFWCYDKPEHPGPTRLEVPPNNEVTTPELKHTALFIGPGSGSKGKFEVLSLPELTSIDCNVTAFPAGNYQSYVSRVTDDGIMLCGGHTSTSFSTCHMLARSGQWFGSPPLKGMKEKRNFAAAVQLSSGWWVTGGYNTDSRKYVDTTELWHNNTWRDHVKLPGPSGGHCIVQLNNTHVLLTGGYGTNYLSSTYIYTEDSGFVKLDNMITARNQHGCTLVNKDTVFVAGGGNAGTKSEYLNLTSLKWAPGPDLPASLSGIKMLTLNGKTILLGNNKKILQLEPVGDLSTVTWWRWKEIGEMTHTRQYFEAFPIDKQQDILC